MNIHQQAHQFSHGDRRMRIVQLRRKLSVETATAFQDFSQKVFADGVLPAKIKQIIAVAVAHVTQCPYCIKGHTRAALRHGASDEELMEAIWVAAEMRAGAAFAHAVLAIDEMEIATNTFQVSS